MGRKERKDIDYFPFFIKDGRTLFILEGKYKCKGTGFFTNVMRFLSRTPDHHFQLKEECDQLFFFTTVKCDQESALDMIEIMVTTGKLDKDLWRKKSVLASQDFLESIQEAYRKRLNNCITMDEIKLKFSITTGRNTQEDGNPAEEIRSEEITTGRSTQSKGKERKVKKKVLKFIPPSVNEVIKYFIEKGYSVQIAKKAFEYYDTADWKDSTGKQVKNWKQKMIAVWFKDENKASGTISKTSYGPNPMENLEKGFKVLTKGTEEEFLKFCFENKISKKDQAAIRGKQDLDGSDLKALIKGIG